MKKILIANRGEIAIRIARTCNDLGIKTVGIFSEDDINSLHLSKMDESFMIDEKGASAYLNIKKIIAIAKQEKVDGIHPGYGFLSENPAFAKAAKQARLKFIGPSEKSLTIFGDKSEAKKLALKLDIPVVRGTQGKTSLKQASTFFKDLKKNSSVVIKAIAGGGGRGMRVVDLESDLKDAMSRASSEAKSAFDSSDLYVEEYLKNYRHVEIQVLGDGKGQATHMHERECSTQRRHQKIIEIAPAPGIKKELKEKMFDASVALIKSSKYEGLATVEFLVNYAKEDYKFIECNARLQVEHTVTEAVLGLDLVRAQIQIASGKTLKQLKLEQKNIPEPKGFAIQSRVNMEVIDSEGEIKPSGGKFISFDLPSGPGVRSDSYGYSGYETNPAFDSLIAKVITHSPEDNFKQALKRNYRSLCEFKIEGVPTNLDLLKNILSDTKFKNNESHTNFLDQNIKNLLSSGKHTNLSDINRSIKKDVPKRGKIEDLDPLAVLDHGKTGGVFVDQSENILQLENDQLEDGLSSIKAPMQGMIVKFDVKKGDEIWKGKPLLIMEAMKMEHEVLSNISGIVKEIKVQPQDTVFEGHSLMTIELAEVKEKATKKTKEVDLDRIRPDLKEALERKGASHDVNRPEAVKKRYSTGHRTARENIEDLCDKGSFVEYGSVVMAAQRRRRTEEDLIKNTTGDGMVCGLGQVNGDLFGESDSRVMLSLIHI